MYARIAFRNIRRSLRDYGIYFLTLVIGIALFYAFNSVTQQGSVLGLNSATNVTLQLLSGLIGGVSVFLAVILGFLVVYANRFLIRRRHREFAIYLTLGMQRSQISRIIVLETLLVGIISLVVGLALGYLLSQVLLIVTARLFQTHMDMFTFFFSSQAALVTIACFVVMFVVALAFNMITISRCKLLDLMNADRKNETITLRSLPLSIVLLVLSIACIVVAYCLLNHTGLTEVDGELIGATCLVAGGTFLFFYSLSGVLLRLGQGNQRSYLKGLHMFTLRQLNNRVNTAWISISLVSLVLFLALTSACGGFSIVSALNHSMDVATAYDASYSIYFGYAEQDGGQVSEQVDEMEQAAVGDGHDMQRAMSRDVDGWSQLVSSGAQIDMHEGDALIGGFIDTAAYEFPKGMSGDSMRNVPVDVIPLSQLNATRALQGLEPVQLADDEYLVWCDFDQMKGFWKNYERNSSSTTLYGQELHVASNGIDDTLFETAAMTMNTGCLVVPDQVIPADSHIHRSTLNVMYAGSREGTDQAFQNAMKAAYPNQLAFTSSAGAWPVTTGATAVEMRDQSAGMTAIVSYLAIYIGVILLITCAAILALQQLSEAADNVSRYALIEKLGADEKMVNTALFQQIGIYFIFPLIVGLCHSVCAMNVVSETVSLLGFLNIFWPLVLTALLAVAVYGGYYLITYSISRNMIRG